MDLKRRGCFFLGGGEVSGMRSMGSIRIKLEGDSRRENRKEGGGTREGRGITDGIEEIE